MYPSPGWLRHSLHPGAALTPAVVDVCLQEYSGGGLLPCDRLFPGAAAFDNLRVHLTGLLQRNKRHTRAQTAKHEAFT